eukprot:358280-Chlamydomonas_euryale.AAC.5
MTCNDDHSPAAHQTGTTPAYSDDRCRAVRLQERHLTNSVPSLSASPPGRHSEQPHLTTTCSILSANTPTWRRAPDTSPPAPIIRLRAVPSPMRP